MKIKNIIKILLPVIFLSTILFGCSTRRKPVDGPEGKIRNSEPISEKQELEQNESDINDDSDYEMKTEGMNKDLIEAMKNRDLDAMGEYKEDKDR